MDSQIINVLDSLCEKFGIAIDWSSQNVIPYIQSLIEKMVHYEIATSIMWIIVAILIICFGLFYSIKIKRKSEEADDIEFYYKCLCLISIFVIIPGLIIFFVQINDIITCMTFPEKILITYFNNLCN